MVRERWCGWYMPAVDVEWKWNENLSIMGVIPLHVIIAGVFGE